MVPYWSLTNKVSLQCAAIISKNKSLQHIRSLGMWASTRLWHHALVWGWLFWHYGWHYLLSLSFYTFFLLFNNSAWMLVGLNTCWSSIICANRRWARNLLHSFHCLYKRNWCHSHCCYFNWISGHAAILILNCLRLTITSMVNEMKMGPANAHLMGR